MKTAQIILNKNLQGVEIDDCNNSIIKAMKEYAQEALKEAAEIAERNSLVIIEDHVESVSNYTRAVIKASRYKESITNINLK